MKKSFTRFFPLLVVLVCSSSAFAQPVNDMPCAAIEIVVDAAAMQYDNTDASADIDEPLPTVQNCILGWCELTVTRSVWFTFEAPANGAVVVNSCLDGPSHDLQVAVYEVGDCFDYSTYILKGANDDTPGGCSANGASIYSSTLQLDGLIPGNTYYLQCDGYNSAVGPFLLEVVTGVPLAKVKFVNNCADALGALVDIRVNGALIVDDLAYQEHTNFLDVLANEAISIQVCNANSLDASNPLHVYNTTLDATSNYIAIGSGILSSSGYSPNVPFTWHMFNSAVLANTTTDMISLLVYHGSTDAPATVDIESMSTGVTIFDNVNYGSYYGNAYANLPTGLYSIELADGSGNQLGLPYCIPLEFAPQTLIVIASGFVNPAANSYGSAFGLYTINGLTQGMFVPTIPGGCVAPFNDLPCNAMELVVNNPPTAGNNIFATAEPDEVHPPGTGCQTADGWCAADPNATISVWYKFVATNTVATVSTCLSGTSLDSQIAVYSAGVCSDYSTYTLIAANDDTPGGCPAANTNYASYLDLFGLTIGNTYYVQVDGYAGQDNPFNIQITAPEGVDENILNALRIYPNPANDVLNVVFAGKSTAQIIDARGSVVDTIQVNGNTAVDISSLAPGVYTITVPSEGNVFTKRFIVE